MKKFEKVNQSNIFLYHVIEKQIFLQIHNILENPQVSNMNSDFVPVSTVSQQREPIPYICDFSRGGLNTRLYTLVSKPCSEATNIGARLSSGAVLWLGREILFIAGGIWGISRRFWLSVELFFEGLTRITSISPDFFHKSFH